MRQCDPEQPNFRIAVTRDERGLPSIPSVSDGHFDQSLDSRNLLKGWASLRPISFIRGFEAIYPSPFGITCRMTTQCPSKESEVPSDHLPTGIINTVIRSGTSWSARMGEPGRSAPQAAASVGGRKNIRCGCQRPSRSLKWACFDIM